MATETQEFLETPEINAIEPSLGESDRIIRRHVFSSMGVGLIPLPLVDLVALTGVQVHMVRKLADLYKTPYSRDRAKNIIASLLGSFTPTVAAPSIAISLTKMIPLLGQAFGTLTMPVLSGAATYAVGSVFVQHFASGGTFLTIDPEKVEAYYMEKFKEGENIAADMKTSEQSAPEEPLETQAAPEVLAEERSEQSAPEEPLETQAAPEVQAEENPAPEIKKASTV